MTKLHWRYARRLNEILDSKIPDSCRYKSASCTTYRAVLKKMTVDGRKVFVSGGLIRDLISGKDITKADVDVKFSHMSKRALKELFDSMRVASYVPPGKGYTYFFVGCDPDNQLEGSMMKDVPDVESPANALIVDFETMELIDITGKGVEDAKNNVWRIPPGVDRVDWFDRIGGPRRLWRMQKFRLRGYKVPDEDIKFIYKMFATMAENKKVKASDYRNLINQVPDPVDMVSLMIQDVSKYPDSAKHIAAVASSLLRSEEVWTRVEGKGNIPYKMICEEFRAKILAEKDRKSKNKKRKN